MTIAAASAAKMIYHSNGVDGSFPRRRSQDGSRIAAARHSFLRISRLIETAGLDNVREPYVKHLDGKVWEIRRVHVFAKKTQKSPRREIETALCRAEEVK